MSETRNTDMERDARLSALYPLTKRDEPPPVLDAAIRAAAQRAVRARPRLAGSPFGRSWRVPLSIAAVVVVSVSLVILMREEAPEVTQAPPAPIAGPGSRPPGATGTRDAERAKPERPAAPKEHARSDGVAASKEARVESAQAESARPNEAKTQSYDVTNSPAVAGNMQGAVSAAKKEPDAAVASKNEESRDVQRARAAPAPAAASAGVPAAAMERQAAQSTDNLLALTSLPPAKWLERIEELRKQGKLDEARASLGEFRKRYPDYPLPDTLKDGIRP